jgi:hypothetical protein
MSGASRVFKARYSNDYLKIEPVVIEFLEIHNYPSLAVSSLIEDFVTERIDTKWIDNNRLKHCISRALGRFGYVKRSKRGKAWEAMFGWCIREADVRKRSAVKSWAKPLLNFFADFSLVDNHDIKPKHLKKHDHLSTGIMTLSSFFPVY